MTKALLPGVAFAALTLLASTSCKLDENAFYNRVFRCDTNARDPSCGNDQSGREMQCFAARQIGATDFCTAKCDPATAKESTSALCLSSGFELQKCNPLNDADRTNFPNGACGSSEMGCMRTDLERDEGVCTTAAPCSSDTDCRDPVRSVCASSFVSALYNPTAPTIKRDHMYCMQIGCQAQGTACSPGEACLRDVIPAAAKPPDICVPNCDSQLRCPPNFLCYRKISTPLAPAVCIPGLLGFTCESTIDCLVGDCTDTGIGYKVCTTGCDTIEDCANFDSEQGKFMCIKNAGTPSARGVCQTPDSYRGTVCATDADCKGRNAAEVCQHLDPTSLTGNCLLPCDAEFKCPIRGGINHTCLPPQRAGEGPACFPGYFRLPCMSDLNCTGDLSCRATLPGKPSVCSIACKSSADCAANKWIGGEAWCVPGLNICLPRSESGEACLVDDQCKSGKCTAPSASGGDDPDGGAPMTSMKTCGS